MIEVNDDELAARRKHPDYSLADNLAYHGSISEAIEHCEPSGLSEQDVIEKLADPTFQDFARAVHGDVVMAALDRLDRGFSSSALVVEGLIDVKKANGLLAPRSLKEEGSYISEAKELRRRVRAALDRIAAQAEEWFNRIEDWH